MRLARYHASYGSILLESVVAIFLYVVGLTAVLALAGSSLKLLTEARGGFLAARAAREGMEMVLSKHKNHTACLDAGTCPLTHWQDNLLGTFEVDAAEADRIDPDKQFLAFSRTPLCVVTLPMEHKGKFSQCTTSEEVPLPGTMTRAVTVEQIDSERARVRVEVTWDKRPGRRASLILEEVVFGAG